MPDKLVAAIQLEAFHAIVGMGLQATELIVKVWQEKSCLLQG